MIHIIYGVAMLAALAVGWLVGRYTHAPVVSFAVALGVASLVAVGVVVYYTLRPY